MVTAAAGSCQGDWWPRVTASSEWASRRRHRSTRPPLPKPSSCRMSRNPGSESRNGDAYFVVTPRLRRLAHERRWPARDDRDGSRLDGGPQSGPIPGSNHAIDGQHELGGAAQRIERCRSGPAWPAGLAWGVLLWFRRLGRESRRRPRSLSWSWWPGRGRATGLGRSSFQRRRYPAVSVGPAPV